MEQKYRQIQVDGLVPFARGGMGECYRPDEATAFWNGIMEEYYPGGPDSETIKKIDQMVIWEMFS